MSSLTKPIKVHGGKDDLAKWIISLIPPRCLNPNNPAPTDRGWLHYVEPYFGGGSVLLANDPEGISEVVNDLNGSLTNFWKVLQSEEWFSAFERRVNMKPFSEIEFKQSTSLANLNPEECDLECAVAFFVKNRQSLSGRMDTFASISRQRTRRGMNEQVSAWLNCIEGLPEVHARLKRVLILNQPALEVISKEDSLRTLFYLDPPYLHETRATTGEYGEFEMGWASHVALLDLLGRIKGRFILSGYHSKLYDQKAFKMGWKCHERKIHNHASSARTKRIMTECCWTNY